MATVQFDYPVKINGKVIPANTPVDDKEIVTKASKPVEEVKKESKDEPADISKLTVEELKAIAAEKGVDVSACTKKADFIDAINRA